ncbi:MAG: hypothetical protein ACI83B_000271 [Sediminicola sp.]|jgi:hypothetical protein
MKKIIIVLSVLLLLGLLGYGFYHFYYPKLIAEAIVNDKYDKIIPKKYQPKFKVFKDSVNSKVDQLVEVAGINHMSFENLLEGIDEVQEEEVRAALAELKRTKITKVEQVFDIGMKHIHINSFDPEVLRDVFIKNVQLKHIKKGLKYIEQHELQESMSPETAKAIIKQILLQKKEKVLKKADGNLSYVL